MFRRVLLAAAISVAFVSAASAATINYTAKLSGAREVPKTDSKGTGSFKGSLDTTSKVLTYTLTFDKLTGPATVAHLHGPAARNANAGVMVPLGDKNPTSPVTGTATLTDDQIKALQGGKVYVNVHTAANPSGEIRGQVYHARKHAAAAAKKTAS
ncbi:MAG TPA: CHRD domain-containing protein [Rhodopila sp.]|uniref:CHRD domain-containing protein n=1 Tax=Rhodopila sp. TaxID=2480087 RepID=UPI002B688FDE|nr:CHRD domain-containing protein [Rhodopila sp.]HVY15247.1 CHRD domain-containing protein [Rhodopila sp.]